MGDWGRIFPSGTRICHLGASEQSIDHHHGLFYAHHILRPKETITVAAQITVLLCPGNCLSVRSIPGHIRKGGGAHGFVPPMGMIEQHLDCVAPGDGDRGCIGSTDGNIIQIVGGHPFKAGVGEGPPQALHNPYLDAACQSAGGQTKVLYRRAPESFRTW